MNKLKGQAHELKIQRLERRSWLRRKTPLYKARMMVGGQAVCLVTREEIAIREGDNVTISGTVRRGVLYARSYANGTRDRWGCRPGGCLHVCLSLIFGMVAVSLAIFHIIPVLAGLGAVALSGIFWSAAELEDYRHRKEAKRALHRYRIGPSSMRRAVSA